MNRNNFNPWFDSPQGQVLILNEIEFLNKTINHRYHQNILQLGLLGWQDQFVEKSSYRCFFVLDEYFSGVQNCVNVNARMVELPLASESIDLVILPHVLEYEDNRYQILREVERVLMPEGRLIILGFNPWSLFSMTQVLGRATGKNARRAHFISRLRMINWLRLLNFEAEVVAGFHHNKGGTCYDQLLQNKTSFSATAYAIHAIKRRINLIPLQPNWIEFRQFPLATEQVLRSTR